MIRHAEFADIETCVDLARKAHALSENYDDEFCPDTVKENLSIRIMNPYSIVLLNEKNDGLICASASQSLYSKNMVIFDEYFYAESEGVWLIKRYIKWAKRFGKGHRIIVGNTFGGELGEKTNKLLKALGLIEFGKLHRVI